MWQQRHPNRPMRNLHSHTKAFVLTRLAEARHLVRRQRRCRLAAAAALLVAIAGAPDLALAQGWNLYNNYSNSYTVPYVTPFEPSLQSGTGALALKLSLNGASPLNFTMDTGSTGLAVTSSFIPGFTASGTKGWVFYNSSGLLLQGYFNTTHVTFANATDAAGRPVQVTATMPVLGITERTCLPNFPNPCSQSGNTFMMGVGVDRNTMGIGTPPGSVAGLNGAPAIAQNYNPLVNLDDMQSGAMRRGYVITSNGLQLGLTAQNTAAGFAYQKLLPLAGAAAGQTASGPGNWQQAAMAVSINRTNYIGGTLLLDTGLNDGFLHVPGVSTKGAVEAGTIVRLQLLNAGGAVGYSFTVGDAGNPLAPVGLNWTSASDSPIAYFNSTLHAYAGFNYLYDADGGFIGLSSNNALPGGDAYVTPVLAASGTWSLTQDVSVGMPVYLSGDSAVATSAVATFNSAITGPGALTVAGTGTVVLNAPNSYAGGTSVQSGTLQLNGSVIGAMTIAAGAQLQVGSTGVLNAGSAAVSNSGTLTNAGVVNGSVTNQGSLVNFGTLNGSVFNSGMVTNTGLINGDVVENGILVNNGTISGTLYENGRVSGNGTYNDLVIGSGASIAPGNSVGIVRVAGNLTFAPASHYLADVGPNGDADQIIAGNHVTIGAGTDVVVNPMAGFVPSLGAAYPILIAGNGISGQFAAIRGGLFSDTDYPFLALALANTPNEVILAITRSETPFAAAATTSNQAAVAHALDTLPVTNALVSPLASLNYTSAPAAYGGLSGETYASMLGVLSQQSYLIRNAINERARAGSTLALSGNTSVSVWASDYGAWGNLDATGNTSSAHSSISGVMIGADGAISPSWRAGFVGGYSQSSISVGALFSSAQVANYDLGLYAGGDVGPVQVVIGATYTWHDISAGRTVAFPGFAAGARANYGAGTPQVFTEVRRAIPLLGGHVEPFLNLAYVGVSTQGFSEGGGGADLLGSSARMDNGLSTFGLRGDRSFAFAGGTLTPHVMVGWQHTLGPTSPTATLRFASGGAAFNETGAPIARNALRAGIGLEHRIGSSFALSLDYQGEVGGPVRDDMVKGALSWRF